LGKRIVPNSSIKHASTAAFFKVVDVISA